MSNRGTPKGRWPHPWVLASMAILAVSIGWRFCDEPEPRASVARRTERSKPVRPSRPVSPSTSSWSEQVADQIAHPSQPPVSQTTTKVPDTSEPHVASLPAAPTADPARFSSESYGEPDQHDDPDFEPREADEPASGEPPCPEPYAELEDTLKARDWGEMEAVLDNVLDRDDCDPGRWPDLQWARMTAEELSRAEREVPKNPVPIMRSMHSSVLSVLDGSAALSERRLTVDDVQVDNQTGLRVVRGVDPETGEPLEILTPQQVEAGEELRYWGADMPNAEGGMTHDLIRYAPLVDRASFNRFRQDPSLRARLPENMRRDFAKMDEVGPMNVDHALDHARARFRSSAEQGLAVLESMKGQYEADMQHDLELRRQREEALRETVEGFLQFRGTPPGEGPDGPLQGPADP